MSEPHPGYFTASLADTDPEVATAIADEAARQNDRIELIALPASPQAQQQQEDRLKGVLAA